MIEARFQGLALVRPNCTDTSSTAPESWPGRSPPATLTPLRDAVVHAVRAQSHVLEIAFARLSFADALTTAGRLDEAHDELTLVDQLMRKAGVRPLEFQGYKNLLSGEAELRQPSGNPRSAHRLLEQAEEAYASSSSWARIDHRATLARVWAGQATALEHEAQQFEQSAKALRCLGKALTIWEKALNLFKGDTSTHARAWTQKLTDHAVYAGKLIERLNFGRFDAPGMRAARARIQRLQAQD